MKENTLVTGKVFPTLIKFAIPFLLANLLQALYGGVDLLIVGQFGDSRGVSAVATGSQIMMSITNLMVGLTTGGTVLIGQYIGAKKEKDAADTVGTMISLFTFLAIILSLSMAISSKGIVTLMNAPKEAFTYTVEYLFICSCGCIFIVGYNMTSGILRGLGDSKTPLIFVAIACVTNIILDIVLIAIFQLGAKGAALATVAAQALSLFLAIGIIKKRGFPFPFYQKNLKIQYPKAKKILLLGLPLALNNGLTDVSFLIITVIINSMGVVASAALGVTERLIGFAMLPAGAFGAAIAAMAAQNIGAGKESRAKQCLWSGILCSFLFGFVICIACQITPEFFTRIFTNEQPVIESAALYLKSFSMDCLLVAFVFCFNGFYSGCGKSLFTMIHGVAATFIVRVPITYAVSKMTGITMYEMGFAAPLASIFSIFCCVIYLKMNLWKSKTR